MKQILEQILPPVPTRQISLLFPSPVNSTLERWHTCENTELTVTLGCVPTPLSLEWAHLFLSNLVSTASLSLDSGPFLLRFAPILVLVVLFIVQQYSPTHNRLKKSNLWICAQLFQETVLARDDGGVYTSVNLLESKLPEVLKVMSHILDDVAHL